MTQKKKLDLKELELQLPSIDSNETKIILGGNDYGDGNGQFDMWYWGGNNNGADAAHDNYQDQGDLDHYYDVDGDGVEDNAGDGDDTGIDPVDHMHDGKYYAIPFGELPDNETQINQNACVQTVMEYLHEWFSGVDDSGTWETEVANWYENEYGTNPMVSGVDFNYIDELLGEFFNIDQIDLTQPNYLQQIGEALEQGHPIFGAVDLGGGEGHAITIIGYNPADNSLIYYDPMFGEIRETDDYPINIIGLFEILGLK